MISAPNSPSSERDGAVSTPPISGRGPDAKIASDAVATKLLADFNRVFGRRPDAIAAAPGRIEFVGNHTDYNRGPVIGAAIDRETFVAVARRADDRWRFASDIDGDRLVDLPGTDLCPQQGDSAWVNYPLGVLHALTNAGAISLKGLDLLVTSTLPVGSGLSSSAALELATAFAVLELTGTSLPLERIVALCRQAENEFVGVPCGILDQAVSAYGQRDHLVFIECAAPSFATLPLPRGVHFWVFNTHTKHALVNGLYAERHRECFDGAKALGVPFLAEASPELLADSPGRMTDVVRRRAQHVIGEIARVRQCRALLRTGDMTGIGRILTASHASSRSLFENSTPELDFLVAALAAMPDVFGARLTGGGFGGAVLAVTNDDFGAEAAETVAQAYREKFNARPDVLHLRSGDGARVLRSNHTVPAA
jgi:galactokinase